MQYNTAQCQELSKVLFGVDPRTLTTDAVATRIAELQQELTRQVALLQNNNGAMRYLLTPEMLASYTTKYLFLESISLINASGVMQVSLVDMPMTWLWGSHQESLPFGAVVYQTAPRHGYRFMVTPGGVTVTNTSGVSGISASLDPQRERYSPNEDYDALLDALKAKTLSLNIRHYSNNDCSHPHNHNWERTFSSMCTGTNQFLSMVTTRKITDVTALGTFLSLLVTWARSANLDDMYGGYATAPAVILNPQFSSELRSLVREILGATSAVLHAKLPTNSACIPGTALSYEYNNLATAFPRAGAWASFIRALPAVVHMPSGSVDNDLCGNNPAPGSFPSRAPSGFTNLDLGVETLRRAIFGFVTGPTLTKAMLLHDVAYTWLLHEGLVNSNSGLRTGSPHITRIYRRSCFLNALRTDLLHFYHVADAGSTTSAMYAKIPDILPRLHAPKVLWAAYTEKGTRHLGPDSWGACFKL